MTVLQAQEEPSVEKNQFKINVAPGVYEHGFNAKNTLYSETGFGYQYSSYSGSTDLEFLPANK
jgi:hypothetical protein